MAQSSSRVSASGRQVSLADKYDLGVDRVYVTGAQALVRMLQMQHARDAAAGHDTAGYVSGYRGSPLGAVDQQFQRAQAVLGPSQIVFQPGLNEDLAATAMWGTQQAHLFGEGRHDGVFGLWYGKGPGVDRCGDVFRHANFAGTAPLGGVLALMGDDHTAESSTTAHQSEFTFVDVMMPILNPAGLQELVDYGLYGYALSRYSGCWVGLKAIKDTIEVTASIDADPQRLSIVLPEDFAMPEGGLNIRLEDPVLDQEARLHDHKRFAATAFARANGLDRMIMAGGRAPKIGIATLGKSYLDTLQALDDLGIDEARAADLGIRLYKVAMPWPLEPEGLDRFAEGLDLILVAEEKRSLIETQIKEQLYGRANAPMIIGKKDEAGATLFNAKGALEPLDIALALGRRLQDRMPSEELQARLTAVEDVAARGANAPSDVARIPYFCAGCPHNTSTVVPDGARGYAGIGCHYMVKWMDRSTFGLTQMGGEGANWIGEAPFSSREHVFINLGDGTYNHSGILAIRAAVYSGVNITYKILFNDAVAMTGGQANEGDLQVADIARQVAAEGVERIAIVTDEPDKYPANAGFPPGATIDHRDDLARVQRELSGFSGVSVLLYDQTCAAEKRRRRKRGLYPDPAKRVIINELVCEGCGDCGVQSNCVAIDPVETELGRKRRINQSACNKDYSCVRGFCPSFVTVEGGRLRKGAASAADLSAGDALALPDPAIVSAGQPYSIVVAGIGGTGVVTIGALLGMAAHLEGKGCGVLDMAGLAQKGGAVLSHLRIADQPDDIAAVRIGTGGADLILGCDIITAGTEKTLTTMQRGRTRAVVNTHVTMTADFTGNPDLNLPSDLIRATIEARVGEDSTAFLDATTLATRLMGDAIASNLFMLGFASQKGLLPVAPASIVAAIELNGVAVAMNRDAFLWGRRAAVDHDSVATIASPPATEAPVPEGLDSLVDRRARFLTAYQDQAYADRYRNIVERIRTVEERAAPGKTALTEAVARSLFKLMAYKDEYEVARLYTDGSFATQVAGEFEGDFKLRFHLAPPLLARKDAVTGHPRKQSFGPWMMPLFRILAGMKRLRGTSFDPFGRTDERRMERRLIADYEATLRTLVDGLTADTHDQACEIAILPMQMRGFGHVKRTNVEKTKAREAMLLEAYRTPSDPIPEPQRAVA